MALSEQLASFFASIKFQVDDKGLKQVDNGIQSLGQRLLGFKSVAAAVGVALQQVVSLKFANITAEEEKFARLNGVLRENVDELKLLATQANVSQETVTGAISQIAKQKQDLAMMKSIPMWVRFGVDPRQSPDKVLKDILKKVKNFTGDTQRQMALLARMGISREFALMFKEGNFELDEATKKLLKFKQTNAQSSTELANNVSTLKQLFSSFLQGLNGIITPIMNLLVKGITKIGKELFVAIEPALRLIASLVKTITDKLTKILSIFSPYILIILKVIAFITIIALGLKGIVASLGLIKMSLLAIKLIIGNPLLIIGAIIGGILAIWKAIDESSFRKFMDYVNASLTIAYELIEDFVDFLNGVENTGFGALFDNLGTILLDQIKTTISQIWQLIKEYIIDPIKENMKSLVNDVVQWFKDGISGIVEDVRGLKKVFSFSEWKNKFGFSRKGLFGDSKEKILPKEQEKLGKQEVKKTNNVKNEIRNEITVNTQTDKPFDLANIIGKKVEGISYQTKINDENDTAGLSCNVALEGSY